MRASYVIRAVRDVTRNLGRLPLGKRSVRGQIHRAVLAATLRDFRRDGGYLRRRVHRRKLELLAAGEFPYASGEELRARFNRNQPARRQAC